MSLPENPGEFEIFAEGNLEKDIRSRLSKLKGEGCQFILCLENCRDPNIHELFKQIACNDLGK